MITAKTFDQLPEVTSAAREAAAGTATLASGESTFWGVKL